MKKLIATPITTHILNLATGMPAQGVAVSLYKKSQPTITFFGTTNADGRVTQWDSPFELTDGVWVLEFATTRWFKEQDISSFYDDITLPCATAVKCIWIFNLPRQLTCK